MKTEVKNLPNGYDFLGRGGEFPVFAGPRRLIWTKAKDPDWVWAGGLSVGDVPCMYYARQSDKIQPKEPL